jgi:Fibronectin type III domain
MRFRSSILLFTIFGALLPVSANATSDNFRSVPAQFVAIYKADAGIHAKRAEGAQSFSLEKQSQFNINFNGVPEDYKPAIQAAVDVWSQNFKSQVPINIDALWERQNNPAVLAAASPGRFFSGFVGAPDPSLWYASAMANALAGRDLDPNNAEITIRINSTNGPNLYLGTDGNCPNSKFDLESIILHELTHGLGFLSNSEYDSNLGVGSISRPTPFDAYAQLPDGRRLMDLPTPSAELGMAMINTLVWSGANAVKANNGVKPKLYTPNPYEYGSSISHLDETTFNRSSTDAVMTPNLSNGEVFHNPGPLAVAMLQDMLVKPPAGTPFGIPQPPQNVRALVSDKSATLYFDPPVNARSAQVTSYNVHINPSGIDKIVTESPTTISGLKNGTSYSFSITAINALGSSEPSTSNSVIPQTSWASSVIDKNSDGKYLTQGIYAGKQFIIYGDSKHGLLKMAIFQNNTWQIKVIDGDADSDGKTTNNVSGNVSYCIGKSGNKEVLDLLYADITDKDLRLAEFNGTKWAYSVVDGNAAAVQDYKIPVRTRTGSDVSISSACARTSNGLQVFYRDQSQGILLGATRSDGSWRYEIVDGDQSTPQRTNGDVAFHLKAINVGDKIYLLYDSVLTVNMDNKPIRGEVRLATRSTANPDDWVYETVQSFGGLTAVAGFDVALFQQGKNIYGAWLTASGYSIPSADQVTWALLTPISNPVSLSSKNYGVPASPVSLSDKFLLFNCSNRLCAINRTSQTISLVSTKNFDNSARAEWITLKTIRYVVSSSEGKLSLFKQP